MIEAMSASLASWLGHFAWPWWLLALPLPWLARALLPPLRGNAAALKVPYGDRLDVVAKAGGRGVLAGGIGLLPWLAWILLCVAAARPQQLGEAVEPPQEGRDLMLALDLSGSMSEPDMELGDRPVDRLTAAKAVLSDFLDRRGGDRVGLIVFGRRAYALTPSVSRIRTRCSAGCAYRRLTARPIASPIAVSCPAKPITASCNCWRTEVRSRVSGVSA